jgi:DAK2 domain fusion protein YloV
LERGSEHNDVPENAPAEQVAPYASARLCDGKCLHEAFQGAAKWLTVHAADVNALNVFPVPDGDTGTNMMLTIESALKEAESKPSQGACDVAAALSHGALMGARGNSGVILSQIIRGIARGLEGKEIFDGSALAESFQAATQTAYRAVSKPVEGTILTVMKDSAEAAARAASRSPGLLAVMSETVKAAWESVERTPTLLAILREAGVVDAGGQGLAVFFEGMYYHWAGELEKRLREVRVPFPEEMAFVDVHGEEEFGYCTNFIVWGESLQVEDIREQIANMGHSAVVAGDERFVKVHVHSEHPGTILDYAVGLGTLHHIEITNMDEQRANLAPRQEKPPVRMVPIPEPSARAIMLISVSPGEGFDHVLRSVGAAAIVPGGQTMNPSTQQLLEAIQSLPSNQVIVLPNNSNIVMTARQAAALSSKDVRVVPTDTVPQGIAALVAFNYESDLETNLAAMEQAAASIQTAEVTYAVRDARLNGIQVKEGQIIALLNGTLEVAGEEERTVIDEILRRMGVAELELITIYHGEGVAKEEAEALVAHIREAYPNQEIELVYGGQPYYRYILSAE